MPAERGDAAEKAQLHPGTGCTGRRIANGAVAQTVERLHGMQEVARSTRASSTGMTAEVADTLRKRRRSGFDSRHLHRAALAFSPNAPWTRVQMPG
jgi:hypothetical protein